MQAMAVPPSAPDIPVQRGADFVEAAIGIVGIAQAQACGGVAQSAQTAHRVIAPAGVEALVLDDVALRAQLAVGQVGVAAAVAGGLSHMAQLRLLASHVEHIRSGQTARVTEFKDT